MMMLRIFRTHRQHEQRILVQDGITIGSDPAADVCLHDSYISPVHAKVVADDDGGFWLVDNDSANGIRNRFGSSLGDRIKLIVGERFELGEHVLEVVDNSQPARPEPMLPPGLKQAAPIAIIAYLLLVLNQVFVEYLYGFEDFGFWPSFHGAVISLAWLLSYAGVGYVVGVLLRGKGYFWQLLALGAGASVVIGLGDYLLGWLSYNLGEGLGLFVAALTFELLVWTVALYLTLSWVSHWGLGRRLAASGFLILLVCFDTYVEFADEAADVHNLPSYNRFIFNDTLRFAPSRDLDEFNDQLDELFGEAKGEAEAD